MVRSKSNLFRLLLISLIVSFLFVGPSPARAFEDLGDYEHNRAMLLGYMLRKDISVFHFSHKKIDDTLSKEAFGLYLKQLDYQKRFLLKEDVERLKVFSDKIDKELNTGKIELPDVAAGILSRRATEVQQMVREILSKDFDFTKDESFETDAEKLEFCKTEEELKERWRNSLKFQVLQRYLNMIEEGSSSDETSSDKAEQKKSPEVLQESAREKILKNYESFFTRMLQETEREHFDRYFSAVARAFDPHSDYMPPMNKEDFDISMKGTLEGIGASLREDDGYIKVASIVPGGPAFRQGQLHAEDVILRVGEGKNEPVDVTDMRLRDAIKLIRGKKGTEVKLTVKKPNSKQIIIPIVRDVVQLEDTFAKGMTVQDEKNGRTFGYIKLPSFYRDFEKTRHGGIGRNSTDDLKSELKKFDPKKTSGLILDLRNNGGGALEDAVKIAGLFIRTGPVVQVKNSDGNISVLSDDDPDISYDGPVAVLVNKFSASASEILAGALQDYGRAIIIGGEHTHGKGTVQSIINFDETMPIANMDKFKPLGALRVTIQKFYRISGESTQYKGVLPDIVLPDSLKWIKSGEQYLDFALPWDTVPPTKYARWAKCRIDTADIRAKSMKRAMSKQDFIDIEAESKKAIELQKKTLQSLNVDVVRKEREEAKKMKEKENKDLHGHTVTDKKAAGKELTEEEKKELWTRDINSDIYVREAVSELNDIISADPACLAAN